MPSNLIRRNANQTVRLHRLITESEWEGNTYDPPSDEDGVEILAVYEPAEGTKRAFWGEDEQAEGQVKTETELHLGDLIEGREIRRVVPLIGFDGQTFAWEAFL